MEAEDEPARLDHDIAHIGCLRFAVQERLREIGASFDHGCVGRNVDQGACMSNLMNSRLGEVRVADYPDVCSMTPSRASAGKKA